MPQFYTAKRAVALFMRRQGHKKHLWLKVAVKIRVRDVVIRFNKQVIRWLGF